MFRPLPAIMRRRSQHCKGTALHIVAYMRKSRTVEPEKRPLLGNGCVTRNNGVTVVVDVFCAVHAEAV
jgi:hypothetical protein